MADSASAAPISRRLSVGQLLDVGFGLARYRYRLLVLTGAWAIVPGFCVSVVLSLLAHSKVLASAEMLVAMMTSALAVLLVAGWAVVPTVLPGGPGPGAVYRAVLTSVPRILVLGVMATVLLVPTLVIPPLGIFLVARWSMVVAAVLLERRGALDALRETWRITRGSFWPVFWVLIVIAAVALVINFIVEGFFFATAALLFTLWRGQSTAEIAGNLANGVSALLATPFAASISVVLFYELKAFSSSEARLPQRHRETGR